MSFLNSLQQYVSSGVASLSLSPKRFSLGRDHSSGGCGERDLSPEPVNSGRSASTGNVIASGGAAAYGFPKVVPPPGTTSPFLRARRKTIEGPPGSSGLDVPMTPRRVGSFRHQRPARTPLMFCRRRQSWPEFDQQATSG
ncbi:UNVERIFIED_CONTAM: hypothetical protein PYX00_008194 [Menopon gallinae]|uniref:Uncharacterized protein n=1 Tax=Menopon gallinae TaxID=328185 RepID=A0AAW2HM11_9NEOP